MSDIDRILTSKEAAEYVGITDNALAKLRMDGRSPEFFRVGRSIRYRWTSIQTWIDSKTATSTNDYAA